MSLNNPEYGIDTILEEEDRHAGDRFANHGAQLILDTAVLLAEKHKTLPPEEAEKFAFAFKEVSDKLAARQDERLESRQLYPPKLAEVPQQPKLVFGPGRKRALTGRKVADQIEADRARECRLAEIRELQDQVQDRDLERRREEQEAQAAAYATQQSLRDSLVE